MKPAYVSSVRQAPHGEKTRIQILDSAEFICAAQGLDAVSIRAVVEHARVNLGAVTYHFGSKQGLLEAMFRRRVMPMNDKRLALLDECEAGGAPTAEQLVHAFVQPPLLLWKEPGCGPHTPIAISQCLSRAFVSPGEHDFLSKYYEPVRSRFITAFRRGAPHLELAEVLWRYNMMVGALVYAMGGNDRMERLPDVLDTAPIARKVKGAEQIDYMVRFLAAGFSA